MTPPLVTAATLAGLLGVSRDYVYEHATDLGALRLGDGPRARLRFDPDRARAALVGTPSPPPAAAPSRQHRRTATTPKPGSILTCRPRPDCVTENKPTTKENHASN